MENNQEEAKEYLEPIPLNLTLDEINLILKALSDRPFREVYELIGKINAQASKTLNEREK